MNYGYVIDSKQGFIYQVFAGTFSGPQIIACTRRLWADPNYSKSHLGIVDISRMTPSAGLADLPALIAFLKSDPHTSQRRWAAITATPLVTAGSMVYRHQMAGRHPFGVFSTWESACGFLQLDMAEPPALTFFSDLATKTTPPVV
ncbi:MAG: hypothetical protein K0R17_425 [Rariglobus sp.]|jgi:hypothetical protein|nr:hypothetical protein [Rariglobus sp.]